MMIIAVVVVVVAVVGIGIAFVVSSSAILDGHRVALLIVSRRPLAFGPVVRTLLFLFDVERLVLDGLIHR